MEALGKDKIKLNSGLSPLLLASFWVGGAEFGVVLVSMSKGRRALAQFQSRSYGIGYIVGMDMGGAD